MKLSWSTLLCFAYFLLSANAGVSGPPQRDPKLLDILVGDAAKVEVRKKLRDPASAQFFDFRIGHKQGRIACGSVNAKNGFSGMAGRERFISNGLNITVLESEMVAGEMDKMVAAFC